MTQNTSDVPPKWNRYGGEYGVEWPVLKKPVLTARAIIQSLW